MNQYIQIYYSNLYTDFQFSISLHKTSKHIGYDIDALTQELET